MYNEEIIIENIKNLNSNNIEIISKSNSFILEWMNEYDSLNLSLEILTQNHSDLILIPICSIISNHLYNWLNFSYDIRFEIRTTLLNIFFQNNKNKIINNKIIDIINNIGIIEYNSDWPTFFDEILSLDSSIFLISFFKELKESKYINYISKLKITKYLIDLIKSILDMILNLSNPSKDYYELFLNICFFYSLEYFHDERIIKFLFNGFKNENLYSISFEIFSTFFFNRFNSYQFFLIYFNQILINIFEFNDFINLNDIIFLLLSNYSINLSKELSFKENYESILLLFTFLINNEWANENPLNFFNIMKLYFDFFHDKFLIFNDEDILKILKISISLIPFLNEKHFHIPNESASLIRKINFLKPSLISNYIENSVLDYHIISLYSILLNLDSKEQIFENLKNFYDFFLENNSFLLFCSIIICLEHSLNFILNYNDLISLFLLVLNHSIFFYDESVSYRVTSLIQKILLKHNLFFHLFNISNINDIFRNINQIEINNSIPNHFVGIYIIIIRIFIKNKLNCDSLFQKIFQLLENFLIFENIDEEKHIYLKNLLIIFLQFIKEIPEYSLNFFNNIFDLIINLMNKFIDFLEQFFSIIYFLFKNSQNNNINEYFNKIFTFIISNELYLEKSINFLYLLPKLYLETKDLIINEIIFPVIENNLSNWGIGLELYFKLIPFEKETFIINHCLRVFEIIPFHSIGNIMRYFSLIFLKNYFNFEEFNNLIFLIILKTLINPIFKSFFPITYKTFYLFIQTIKKNSYSLEFLFNLLNEFFPFSLKNSINNYLNVISNNELNPKLFLRLTLDLFDNNLCIINITDIEIDDKPLEDFPNLNELKII